MLALVSHMFIRIKNGDIFASSNHRDVFPSTKFVPLIFFYYQCVTQWKITINVLSTKNHMWFFSKHHTDSKKNSGREQAPVFQPGKICKDWFSHCNWVLMENFSSFFLLIQSIWNLFCTVIILSSVCIEMVDEITTVVFNRGNWSFFYFENNHAKLNTL